MVQEIEFPISHQHQQAILNSRHLASQIEMNDRKINVHIPNYKIELCIGSGGFGSVFRARRNSDDCVVAIKVLQPQGGLNDAIKTRFLREATLLCQLSHPRIVRFRELGISGEQFYLVMDYINSISWHDLSCKMDENRRQVLVFQIIDLCLDALVYLHGRAMVHRDIKLSNLLFEKQDRKLKVYLADFGLAKDYLQAGLSGVTSDNEIAGTLAYMGPELLGGVKYYRPESDQYAMAATCFEMLSGRPPLNLKSPANALALIRQHKIPRIETLVPNLAKPLADWLHRGLQTDPKNRFESASAMRESLKEILDKTKP